MVTVQLLFLFYMCRVSAIALTEAQPSRARRCVDRVPHANVANEMPEKAAATH